MANKGKGKEKKALGGDMETAGVAFIYWSTKEERFELLINNKLKAYTDGKDLSDHEEAFDDLQKLAEDKGYTVVHAK